MSPRMPWCPGGSRGYAAPMNPYPVSRSYFEGHGNSFSNGPTPTYGDLNHPPEIYNGLTAPR